MQGFGNPQVTFAVESLMDELAEKLGMDPIELRLKNYVGLGDTFWGQGPLVRSIVQSDGVPRAAGARARRQIGWERRRQARSRPRPQTDEPLSAAGIGLARGFHTSSAGAPQPGDVIDFSGAMVKINQDGSVDVITALMDHGGGTLEADRQAGRRDAVRAAGQGEPVAAAHTTATVYDVVHARHPRRLCRRRRGDQGGAGRCAQELLETAARFLNVQPEALTLEAGRGAGPGRRLRALHPGRSA